MCATTLSNEGTLNGAPSPAGPGRVDRARGRRQRAARIRGVGPAGVVCQRARDELHHQPAHQRRQVRGHERRRGPRRRRAGAGRLDANKLPIGAGSYTVEEVQKPGWVASEAPSTIHVPLGSGSRNFGGNDFGNYRPAKISGHKFDDPDVDGLWTTGAPGLGGWTIELSNGDAAVTTTRASTSTQPRSRRSTSTARSPSSGVA